MKRGVLLLAMIVGTLLACDQKSSDSAINQEYYILDFDDNRSILVELEIFPAEAKGVDISNDEVLELEAILARYIEESFNKKATSKIHLQDYGRQYVSAFTGSGEEVVYVNCFCQPNRFENRRTKLVVASDGGQCFFSLKIDPVAGKAYGLLANGPG